MSELNQTVVNLIDLRYQAKNAHWNCKGTLFYEFHLMFDRIYDDYEDLVDRCAERLVGLGGRVMGTVSQVSNDSNLSDQPELISSLDLAADLLSKVKEVKSINNTNIDTLLAANEQVTANLLMTVGETLDTHIFLLSSSLR